MREATPLTRRGFPADQTLPRKQRRPRCRRCGGAMIRTDGDDTCLLCGRPLHPPRQATEAELRQVSKRMGGEGSHG